MESIGTIGISMVPKKGLSKGKELKVLKVKHVCQCDQNQY